MVIELLCAYRDIVDKQNPILGETDITHVKHLKNTLIDIPSLN